ncbi:MAG: OmpH family outer membrane protein [Deltaproteobacteria bacterium]|nr:OmpH family outer membrane protein [Deltaproteobacteria bacterium]
MKKAGIFACLVMIACLYCTAASATDYKIGYVAIQKAVTESLAGKEAMKRFEVDVKQLEEDLLKEKADIEKLGEMLQKQSMMLTDDVRRSKEKDFLKRQRDYERSVKDTKTDIQIKEAELTNEILEDLLPLITKYGKDNGYSVVFEKNERILLYAAEALDLTDKIIALFDAKHNKK